MIDPAKLNRRLTVRRRVLIEDPQWGDTWEWQDHRTTWGAMAYESVDEEFAAGQHYTERTVTFTMRFSRDLTEVDRVVCEGIEYEILGVTEMGNRAGLEVKASVLDPGGGEE